MRQNFLGVVISTAMQKTVRVRVMTQKEHPVIRKTFKSFKNYMAHDESSQCQLGDVVRIEGCRPISAKKRFTVAEIVDAAKTYKPTVFESSSATTTATTSAAPSTKSL